MKMLKEGESVDEYMKRALEEQYKEQNIWCPYCNQMQDEETKSNHVTYWGEPHQEEDEICCCDDCGKEFRVKESVRRTFETEVIQAETK